MCVNKIMENLVVLKDILDKLLSVRCKVSVETVAKLVEYVKTTEKHSITPHTNTYINWIEKALSQWKTTSPPQPVAIFLLEVCAVLANNEMKFLLLNNMNILDRVISTLHLNKPGLNKYYKQSFINVLISLKNTTLGVDWLITWLHCWQNVLLVNNEDLDLCHQGLKTFLVDLFFKVAGCNRLFFINNIKFMIAPILEMSRLVTTKMDEKTEQDWFRRLSPVITLVIKIFEGFLENIKQREYYKLLKMYHQMFNFEDVIVTILKHVETKEFTLKVSSLLLPLYFFDLAISTDSTETIKEELVQEYLGKIANLFKINIKRGFLDNIFRLLYTAHIYRSNIFLPITYFLSGTKIREPFLFEHQFLVFQLVPLWAFNLIILGKRFEETISSDEYRDQMVHRLISQTYQDMLHLVYKWRNLLYHSHNLMDETIEAEKYILKSVPFYSLHCGEIIFQTAVYIIGDIVSEIEKNGLSRNMKEYELMSLLLEIVIKCIQCFEFTWKDTIEVVDVMGLSSNVLNLPFLPVEIITKSLKLMEQSISKYMSPNLALLIETNDSTMHIIGPLLYLKLKDKNVEVQKIAMQVLLRISENAKEKFPYFKKILLDSELPIVVVKTIVSQNDLEVKRVAVMCLEQVALMSEFWDGLIDSHLLQGSFLKILQSEEEAPIRVEMIRLMRVMYEQDYFSELFVEDLCEAMYNIGLNDKISVRLETLYFWRTVIRKHLQDEGYIDHRFPDVTFSKKLKKIVVLNKAEIQRRFSKTMRRMSELGFFSAFLSALLSNNKELFEYSKMIADRLTSIMKINNISCENTEISTANNKIDTIERMLTDCVQQLELNSVNVDYLHLFGNDNSQDHNKFVTLREYLNACQQRDHHMTDSCKKTEENCVLNNILIEIVTDNAV